MADLNGAGKQKDHEPASGREKVETRVDRILKRLKNHPIVAIIVVLGIGVISFGAFTDAVDKILQLLGVANQTETSEYVFLRIDATAVPPGSIVTVTDSSGQKIAETVGGPSEIKVPLPRQYMGQQITVKVTIPGYEVRTYEVTLRENIIIPDAPKNLRVIELK